MKDTDFCRRLTQLRKAAGLSQKELGEKLGTGQSIVSQYEVGTAKPGLQSLKELCKALNCSSIELLGV